MKKTCRKCLKERDHSDFYRHARYKDGIRSECKDCYRERGATYYNGHKQEYSDRQATYYNYHKKERMSYISKRLKIDLNFKLAGRLRTRMYIALKKGYKSGSAVRDLGCSIGQFRSYIENQFEPGMSWNNYGRWHLDHVQPLASFDLTDRSQFLTACNWLNYQPMWARDNIRKGNA